MEPKIYCISLEELVEAWAASIGVEGGSLSGWIGGRQIGAQELSGMILELMIDN